MFKLHSILKPTPRVHAGYAVIVDIKEAPNTDKYKELGITHIYICITDFGDTMTLTNVEINNNYIVSDAVVENLNDRFDLQIKLLQEAKERWT